MPVDAAFLNQGISIKRVAPGDPSQGYRSPGHPSPHDPSRGRTFIVSGVARGGATMLAELLREAGLHMGDHLANFVSEDLEMMHILRGGDPRALDQLIAARNAHHRDWGFRIPNIQWLLRYADVSRFRNPHLILIFRDVQAIAVRAQLAEYHDPMVALRNATAALHALAAFAEQTNCPTLMLSYEKALVFPGAFIGALLQFCGLPANPEIQGKLLARMQPNAPAYITGARRQFVGWVDGVVDGSLTGWCCETGTLSPVELDLHVAGRKAVTVRADLFRKDVLDAGFGNGMHGFAVSLTGVDPASRLDVAVTGRTFVLQNSGRSILEYLG